MEQFSLTLSSRPQPRATQVGVHALRGVVASGDLEVLVECGQETDQCCFDVRTAAAGFRDTWEAVLTAFVQDHACGGLSFTLNDVGSTPAVVALRLAQAHEAWLHVIDSGS